MGVAAVMTTLCTTGIAFYVRFLVALCTERKRGKISHLVRRQPDSGEYRIPKTRDVDTSIPRVA